MDNKLNIQTWNPKSVPITPQGLYVGMPNEVYHDSEGVSKSSLDLIHRSPAHYYHRSPYVPSRAMEIGTAIHTAILEPDAYETDYVLLDVDARTASEYKQAVKAVGSGRVLVKKEWQHVEGVATAVAMDPHAGPLFEGEGHNELSVIVENEHGITLRCRFDRLLKRGDRWLAVDLKKTRDARPDKFSRSVTDYRYHVQVAWYSRVAALAGIDLAGFVFVAVEDAPPHGVRVYVIDDESVEIGRREAMEDLRVYTECVRSGHWPVYDTGPQLIGITPWAMRQAMEQEDE